MMTMILMDVVRDALKKQRDDSENYEVVFGMYDNILEASMVARRVGLLGLEESINEMVKEAAGPDADTRDEYFYKDLSGLDRLFAILMMLIVDGTEPEMVEDIGVFRYYAADYQGAEALAACMAVIGIRMIQDGCNPAIIRQNLLALMPGKMEEERIKRTIQEEEEAADGEEQEDGTDGEEQGSGSSILGEGELEALLHRA